MKINNNMNLEIQLLKNASLEIKALRSQNQLMSARLEMFDRLMRLFETMPRSEGGQFAPDITYDIDKAVAAAEGNAETLSDAKKTF